PAAQSRSRRTRCLFFFFQAEDGIRDLYVTGVQTCALPICRTTPRDYLNSRPIVAEVEAAATAISLAGETGSKLHIVHIANSRSEIGRASCREKCRSRWWPDH